MMLVRILGPVEVFDGQDWRRTGSLKRGCVLAALVLAGGMPLSNDTLMHRLWDGDPPNSARGVLYNHVAQLRRQLRPHTAVSLSRAESGGYRLELPDGQSDVSRMRVLAARARAATASGDHTTAVELWRQAEDLWRGPALFGAPGVWAEQCRTILTREHTDILTGRYRSELALGRHAEVVTTLDELVFRHRLSQTLTAHLMVALYRCGRPAEALARYAELRIRLRDELGSDPTDQLRRLHQRIVKQDPELLEPTVDQRAVQHTGEPSVPVPAQLPADLSSFVGRRDQLEVLVSLADQSSRALVVSVVDGMAGVGKTAMAVHVGTRLAASFPDGQLFIDMHGFSAGVAPVEASDALFRLLQSLGVEASKIPDHIDDRAGMFRSAMGGRRMLIILDNVANEDQVRPLLPGNSKSMVVITSRNRLVELDDTHAVSLDVLPCAEATDLLVQAMGRPGGGVDEAAVLREVVELCGRLPLAIRLVAARMHSNPYWTIEDLRDRLVDHSRRLAELRVGQRSVEAAFMLSYQDVDEEHGRLFRLLGLFPGTQIAVAAAAALAGLSVPHAERLLDRLAAAHVVSRVGTDRFVLHDLLRLFAQNLCAEAERIAARQRLQSWYVHSARAGSAVMVSRLVTLPAPALIDDVAPMAFSTAESARSWFVVEQPNLVALVRDAAVTGSNSTVWLLADAMRFPLSAKGDRSTLQEMSIAAIATAEAAGDFLAQAVMRYSLATCEDMAGRSIAALRQYRLAVELAKAASEPEWEGQLLTQLACIHYRLGETTQAITLSERARQILQVASPDTVGSTFTVLGLAYWKAGELRRAVDCLGESARFARRHRGVFLANALGNLALAQLEIGELNAARDTAGEAIDVSREIGSTLCEMSNMENLALIQDALGQSAEAVKAARQSLAMATRDRIPRQQVLSLMALAIAQRGNPRIAVALADRAIGQAKKLADPNLDSNAQLIAADVYRRLGHPERAAMLARRALESARARGYVDIAGKALTVLAEVHCTAGDWDEALSFGAQALASHLRTGHRPGQARVRRCLARTLDGSGQPQRAAVQIAKADQLNRAMIGNAEP